MKARLLIPPLLIILLILPAFLPSVISFRDASFTPNYVEFFTPNPSFEKDVSGWEIKGNISRASIGYAGNRSLLISGGTNITLQEPTEYMKVNDTLILTLALKGLKQLDLSKPSYIDVSTLAFWSWKEVIPIHVMLTLNLSQPGFSRVVMDESGIYIFREVEHVDEWREYRLQLGSPTLRQFMAEYLKSYRNETLATPEDEFYVRFLFIKARNLEGYIDQIGMGRLLPSLVTLDFTSYWIIPMSYLIQGVESNGQARPYEVSQGYTFTITYLEPVLIPSNGLFNVTVYFLTGQRVLVSVEVSQRSVVWV